MWVLILAFFILVFPSLCDADKKSCLSGIAGVIVVGVIMSILIVGNYFFDSFLKILGKVILYSPIALIVLAIISGFIDSAKMKERNKRDQLIKQLLSTQKCPHCQSKNIILPNYYGIIHDINQQQLYCQDCGETWVYKEE